MTILLLVSLLFGTVVSIPLAAGVNIYMHDIVVFVLVGVAAFSVFGRRRLVKPKLIGPIVAFAAAALLSLLVNWGRFAPRETAQAGLYLLRWILYAGVYASIVQTPISAPFLVTGLFWTGTAFSALGLVQFFLYSDLRNLWYLGWDPHYWRLFSTFLDPNYAGMMITLTIFLGFHFNKNSGTIINDTHVRVKFDTSENIMRIVAFGVNLVALYLTYSRASYLAFAVGFGIWVALEKKKLAGLLLMFFIGAVFIVPRPGGETLRLGRVDSTISRLENWQEAIGLFQTSPIIGHGFNTLRVLERQHSDGVGEGEAAPISRAAAGVDNSILFLLVTTGVVGLVSYGWLALSSVTLVGLRKPYKPIFWALFASTLVHSMFTNTLFYPWVMLWWWIFIGAEESSSTKENEEN